MPCFQIQLVPLHRGGIARQETVARAVGTTVTLRNIFTTLPVRHKEFTRNVVGLYKLNPVVTHSLKAPGFNP
jgi:DNA mismatch repair ATPase MutL